MTTPPANIRFVPDDFAAPRSLEHALFALRPLDIEHNERDYAAWTTSLEHIASTPGFNGADATIQLYPLDGNECPRSTLVTILPYTHQVTLLSHRDRKSLLASTLCAGKAHKEGWTQPGAIHLAEVPADPADRPQSEQESRDGLCGIGPRTPSRVPVVRHGRIVLHAAAGGSGRCVVGRADRR